MVCIGAVNDPLGSRRVLPLSSPLRTGHEDFPSSGSGPEPLSPVLLMTLPRAPGVYKTFITKVVRSTLSCRDDMIRFYAFSRYERDMTQRASVSLLLGQYQPLFLVGFPSSLLLLALQPVLPPSWVIWGVSPCDLGEACDRGCIGLDQFCLSCPKCPLTVAPEVACFSPFTSLVWVSAFCPNPEHLPLGMADLLKDLLGCTVPVIIRPSSYNRIQFLDNLPCRGLFVSVQIGSNCPHVFEDFFLRWDSQHFALLPEFPDVKPQEVHPFFDVYSPGFCFTECQPSVVEELLQSRSGMGFQYFSCGGRCHKVVGIS
jgi:hypothetical protein